MRAVDLAQHKAADPLVHGFKHLHRVLHLPPAGRVPSHGKQHCIGRLRDDPRIGHHQNGRRVDDDVIEPPPHLPDKTAIRLRHEQIGGIDAGPLSHDQRQAQPVIVHQHLVQRCLPRQKRHHPPLARLFGEIVPQSIAPDVAFHQQHRFADAHQIEGQTQRIGGLALARHGRGQQDHLRRLVHIRQQHRSAQVPDCLHRARGGFFQQIGQNGGPVFRRDQRDLPHHHRACILLQMPRRAIAIAQRLAQQHRAPPGHQPQKAAYRQDQALARRGGRNRNHRSRQKPAVGLLNALLRRGFLHPRQEIFVKDPVGLGLAGQLLQGNHVLALTRDLRVHALQRLFQRRLLVLRPRQIKHDTRNDLPIPPIKGGRVGLRNLLKRAIARRSPFVCHALRRLQRRQTLLRGQNLRCRAPHPFTKLLDLHLHRGQRLGRDQRGLGAETLGLFLGGLQFRLQLSDPVGQPFGGLFGGLEFCLDLAQRIKLGKLVRDPRGLLRIF